MFSKIQKVFAWLFSLCFSLVLIGMWGIEHLFNEKLPIADSIKWTESCNYTLPFTVPRYFDALLVFAIPWILLYVYKKGKQIIELCPCTPKERLLNTKICLISGFKFGLVIGVFFNILMFIVLASTIMNVKFFLIYSLKSLVGLSIICSLMHLDKSLKEGVIFGLFTSLVVFSTLTIPVGVGMAIHYGLPTGVVILTPSFILILLGLNLTHRLVKKSEPKLPLAIARNT